jgi:hypothetical protein
MVETRELPSKMRRTEFRGEWCLHAPAGGGGRRGNGGSPLCRERKGRGEKEKGEEDRLARLNPAQ